MFQLTRHLVRAGTALLLVGTCLAAGSSNASAAWYDRLRPHSLRAPAGPLVVLYDQTSTADPGFDYAESTDLKAVYDGFDSQGADDFQVPTDKIWLISTVTAHGQYEGLAQADSVLIQFYVNGGSNLPSSLVRSEVVPPAQISGRDTGIFVMNLAAPAGLGPGRYWLAVQANMNSAPSLERWGWHESTQQFLSASAWRQPGGGYGPACVTFQPRIAVCNRPAGSVNPDLLFKLEGSEVDVVAKIALPVVFR